MKLLCAKQPQSNPKMSELQADTKPSNQIIWCLWGYFNFNVDLQGCDLKNIGTSPAVLNAEGSQGSPIRVNTYKLR